MLIPVIVISVLVLMLVFLYNSLIGKRNKVRNSWSQIDVQLKGDLILSLT